MNMKTLKKNAWLLVALATALILASALIVGCIQPASSTGLKIDKPPEGMGSVTLNFGNARTVLPPSMTAAGLDSFNLVFTPVPADDPINRTISSPTGTTTVPIGDYTLIINGMSDFGVVVATASSASGVTTDRPLGGVQTAGFSILDGQDTKITATLSPIGISGTGNGRLAWTALNVNSLLPTVVQDANVTVVRNGSSTGEDPEPIFPLPTPPATVVFPTYLAGSYWFDVFIETDKGYINYRDTAHIYQGMTTTITIPTYADGDTYLEVPSGNGTSTGETITFDFTSPTDQAVSATLTPTVNISSHSPSGLGTQTTPFLLSLNDVTNPSDLTLTLGGVTFTDTEWYGNGGQIGVTGDTAITIVGGTTPGFKATGLISITVGGTMGGELYSKVFWVRITTN
jgi:hypothetical protein